MLSPRTLPSFPAPSANVPPLTPPLSPRPAFRPVAGAEVNPWVWSPRQTSANVRQPMLPTFGVVAPHSGIPSPQHPHLLPAVGPAVMTRSPSAGSLHMKWPGMTGPGALRPMQNAGDLPRYSNSGPAVMPASPHMVLASKHTPPLHDTDDQDQNLKLCYDKLEASAEENLRLRALLGGG